MARVRCARLDEWTNRPPNPFLRKPMNERSDWPVDYYYFSLHNNLLIFYSSTTFVLMPIKSDRLRLRADYEPNMNVD